MTAFPATVMWLKHIWEELFSQTESYIIGNEMNKWTEFVYSDFWVHFIL